MSAVYLIKAKGMTYKAFYFIDKIVSYGDKG